MTDDINPPLHYYGGPRDGELVQLEPGWAAPDRLSHIDWATGHYELEYVPESKSQRYVWRSAPLPGST